MTEASGTMTVPRNPVSAARERIAAEFDARPEEAFVARTPAEACLCELLNALGWTGEARNVLEAMPHLEKADDLMALRIVLHNLGFRSMEGVRLRASTLGQVVPCLLVAPDGGLSVVVSVEENERAVVFEGRTRERATYPVRALKGRIVRIVARTGEPEAPPTALGWVPSRVLLLRRALVEIGLLSMAVNLLTPVTTLYVMTVYDKAIGTRSLDTLGFLVAGVLLAILLEIRLRDVRARRLADLGGRIDAVIAVAALGKLLHLPVALTEGAGLGPQLARFRQFEIGREMFQGRLAAALIDLPFTVIFFTLIFVLGGALGFVPVALAVVVGVVTAVTAPVVNVRNQKASAAKTRSDQMTIEITTKLGALHNAGAGSVWLARSEEAYADYVLKRYQANQMASALQSVSQFCVTVSGILMLGLGALQVMHGHMSVGALVAIMSVAWRVLGPIQDVLLSLNRLVQLRSTLRQIDQLMRMRPEREPGLLPTLKRRFGGAVSVSGVVFRYPNRQDLSLRGVGLDIAPGEFVAIAGPSGSGKTTLLRLMMGLHQPQGGSIRYDGLDLRQLDLGDLRRTVGYMPQSAVLFHGTLAQNIRLAAPDATDGEIVDILHRLDLALPNPLLPEGIDTRIDAALRERLSQPVLQRLLLARVFIRQRPILLLDEPATYLDRSGDEAFQALLRDLKGRTSVLMVSARPSHMRLCDRVAYMADGAIAAVGPAGEMVPKILAQTGRAAS